MYCDFYQMRERPFNVTADPKFLYLNARYREALASLHYGISQRKGFVTLIGEAGTGKTTLLKKLLDDLDQTTRTVFIFNTNVSFDEILEYIFGEFDLPVHNGKRLYMLQRLNQFLLEELAKGRNVALLIDEAQDLDYSVLEDLRLLSNLETAKEKILQIVLSGQPELGQKLGNPGLRQLRQRVAVNCRLLPLNREELGEYVQARLTAAGAADPKLFARDAEERIFEISAGIPRLVNIVCDNALVIGYALGKKRIGADVVNEAAADLLTVEPHGATSTVTDAAAPVAVESAPRARRVSRIAVVGVVAAALLIGLLSVGRSLLRSDGGSERTAAARPPLEVVQPGRLQEPAPAAPVAVPVDGRDATAPALDPEGVPPQPAAPPAAQAPGAPPIGPEVAVAEHAGVPVVAALATVEGAPLATPARITVAAVPPAVEARPDVVDAEVGNAPVPEPAAMVSAPPHAAVEQPVQAVLVPPTPIEIALAATAAPAGVDELRLVVPNYERLMVKPGDSISQIASDTYGQASPTVLDMMKMANPSIRNLDIISVGQELRLPQLDEGLAVLQQPDGRYALLLLSTPAEGRARDIGRALRRHGLETRVGKADFGRGREVWRVVIGDLPDRQAARAVGEQLQRVFREDARIAQMAE